MERRTVLVVLEGVAGTAANDATEPGLSVAGELQRQLHGLRTQGAAEEAAHVGARQHSQGDTEADLCTGEQVANDQGTNEGTSLA